MNFVKIILTKGDPVTIEMDKAQKILESDGTLFMIPDKDGNWSGDAVMKSHIVQIIRDFDAEKDWNARNSIKISAPPEKEQTPEMKEKVDKIKKDISNKFNISN